ncbi:MAG: pseudouridine synthase [Desulfatiglandaceae bacterium]
MKTPRNNSRPNINKSAKDKSPHPGKPKSPGKFSRAMKPGPKKAAEHRKKPQQMKIERERNVPTKTVAAPARETEPQRLNKVISTAGVASRRTADQWIREGRISINGNIVTDPGTRVDRTREKVAVDGKPLPSEPAAVYILLNKPFGYLCTLKDPGNRPLVTDLLKDVPVRVYPVGRLDFDTLGLLLMTNDGALAHKLTHPSYQIPRTYKATVSGYLTDEAMFALRNGIELEDGPSGPSNAAIVSRNNRQSSLRITIRQGRSRQIRRMLEAVGYLVIHLIRIGFGPLTLGDLKLGQYRSLDDLEVQSLHQMVERG